ncbi:MAG: stalled ribosome rescue protein Dom34 [Flavobacteriales bacterium]|jgi:stalled ribosome rescue protein Dom34
MKKTNNNLGVWMDHSNANLINLDSNKATHSISSQFTSETKEDALNRSESLMHNKRQQMQEKFYKKIGSEILKFRHVLLFGPTNAKVELHNYLNKNLHFKNIKIDIESSDKMTDNEQIAFVKRHF